MAQEIKLGVSKRDMRKIRSIVSRAFDIAYKSGLVLDRICTEMDLCCVHNDVGLRLDSLLAADDFNFSHDVFGIVRHLNRETGKLKDFFLPRFSA